MKKLFLFIFSLGFIFAFNITVLADEGHSHDSSDDAQQEVEVNEEKTNTTINSEEGEVHDDTEGAEGHEAHLDSGDHSSEGTEGGHEEESEGHHGPVVETPPNYKVLGTYGAVNLSFILIGVWNKWFRRKENK
ncbi:hypothetical protein ABE096_06030 [Robertmurraya massiliosenegalensis]|uniref:hypothetical protein n=1 Tax=Robertmurraya TaxID=2837507 RepID=UPI0039A53F44